MKKSYRKQFYTLAALVFIQGFANGFMGTSYAVDLLEMTPAQLTELEVRDANHS
jgi:hypothetical protein